MGIPEWHWEVEDGVVGTVFLEDFGADVFVAEIGGQPGERHGHVLAAGVALQQAAHGKGVSQIVVVPMSAQSRLCRPPRYADLGPEPVA